ncbi:MAG: hypothetical protein ACJ8EQ_04790 [Sphingomicrobium sp.]
MSIGTFASGEAALSEQTTGAAKDKVPRRRQTVAKADVVAQPEAR